MNTDSCNQLGKSEMHGYGGNYVSSRETNNGPGLGRSEDYRRMSKKETEEERGRGEKEGIWERV